MRLLLRASSPAVRAAVVRDRMPRVGVGWTDIVRPPIPIQQKRTMKSSTDMAEVFAIYGYAAYHAQLLEYDLVTAWMLESIAQGVSLTREDLCQFQGEWSRKTLGKLLHPLSKSALIPDDIKEFLETVRKTRNTLAHDFFLTVADDLRSSDGRETAKAKLEDMAAILERAHDFITSVLTVYSKDFGVDYEAVHRKLMGREQESTSRMRDVR